MQCPRCNWTWDYSGKGNYAQCQKCLKKIWLRKPQKSIATEEQPIQNDPPKVNMNEIIISDNFEDVDYIFRDPEVITVPHLKKVLYRGKRRRAEPEGNIYKSIPKPPEQPKPNPMEAMMALHYMEQLEAKKEEKTEHADPIDALINGSPDEAFNAALRLKLQQLITRQQS